MVEKFAKDEPNIVHCTSWTEDTVHKAEPGYFVLNVCVRDLDKALFFYKLVRRAVDYIKKLIKLRLSNNE